MTDVISSMLELFGISTVPSTIPEFLYWFCSLAAGVIFIKSLVAIIFGFVRNIDRGMR